MSDRYEDYQRLQFDRPHPRVLRVTMSNPGKLNAADRLMHGELGRIWRDVDADPSVSVGDSPGRGPRLLRRRRFQDDRANDGGF